MTIAYSRITVPVTGGELAVGRWGSGPQVVLASHGITANHLSWQRVAELVVERSEGTISVLAVDHRGRAGSAAVGGPFGPAAHADDLIAVLDHLGVQRAVLAGHSMGGFVVATAAERHPDRVSRLVLVDGGLPLPGELPEGIDVETAVRAVIGPALDRLDMRWDSVESYVDFFRVHPAFRPPNPWPAAAEAYVRLDAVLTPEGQVRSSVSKDAVLIDGGAAIVEPASARAIERITTPAHLLWAPRGLLDQTPGLYPAEAVESATVALPHLSSEQVPDTNHYTITVSDHGASIVAAAVAGG
jgi:pimeloyl-ACP methyl ester carboxylesterase